MLPNKSEITKEAVRMRTKGILRGAQDSMAWFMAEVSSGNLWFDSFGKCMFVVAELMRP